MGEAVAGAEGGGGGKAARGRRSGGAHRYGEKGRGRQVGRKSTARPGRKMLVGAHLGTVGRAQHGPFAPLSP